MKYFPATFANGLFDRFIEIANDLIEPEHLADVHYSDTSFFQAIEEADCDAVFMKERRHLDKGISEGKLAGTLYFRLTRHRIIHLSKDICERREYQNLQERVAIALVSGLLRIDLTSRWIRDLAGTQRPGGMKVNFQNLHRELIYVTSKRHYNQESLALFFDACAYLAHAINLLQPQSPDPNRPQGA